MLIEALDQRSRSGHFVKRWPIPRVVSRLFSPADFPVVLLIKQIADAHRQQFHANATQWNALL